MTSFQIEFFSANGSGTDKRNGAASDCESDDGEEGDYTVYECPGLAPVRTAEFVAAAVFLIRSQEICQTKSINKCSLFIIRPAKWRSTTRSSKTTPLRRRSNFKHRHRKNETFLPKHPEGKSSLSPNCESKGAQKFKLPPPPRETLN